MPDFDKPRNTGNPGQPIRQSVGLTERRDVRKRRMRIAAISAGVVGCLLLVVVGVVIGTVGRSTFLSRLFREHGWSTMGNLVTGHGLMADWNVDKQFPNQTSLNVLVMGVDHDYSNKATVENTPARSDSILIARFDFVNKTINALTIPRDSAVRIPGHTGIHKINAAHAYGGPDLTAETIRQVLGINTDSYVELNFEGFQKLVDSVGGVDIDVKKNLNYDDNWGKLHIHLKKGFQHLNGYQAMGYVRIRHSDSDMMRSERQHEFLEAMRGKISGPGMLEKLPVVFDGLNDSLKRSPNMSQDQLLSLINFAKGLPKQNINVATLPSFEGPSYVTIDSVKAVDVIQKMFFPNQQVALNIDAPDPNDVRSMNAPYERGSRRHSRRRKARTEHATRERTTETPAAAPESVDEPAPTVPPEGLSVESPSGQM